jgi:hypothetical protein
MPRKPKLKPDDPEQSKRFIEAAREHETDETGEAFERVLKATTRKKPEAGNGKRKMGQRDP